MAVANIGVAIHEKTSAGMLAAITHAEQAGVPAVWLTTGAGPDALTVFAAASTVTSRVRMGTAVVPTYPRHPLVVAQQAADIAALAPGRFTLGLGPSHKPSMEIRYGIPYVRPLGHLREFVGVVKRLLTGEHVKHTGERFRVDARLFQGAQVPVIVSALRSGSFRLAGELADGAVTWLCPPAYLRSVALPAMAEGAAKAGRARPRLIAHAYLALTTDAAALEQGLGEALAHYPTMFNYQEMFANAGFPEARAGKWSQGMRDAVLLHGTEAVCRDKVRAFLETSGAEELVLSVMATGADRGASLRRSLDWVGALQF